MAKESCNNAKDVQRCSISLCNASAWIGHRAPWFEDCSPISHTHAHTHSVRFLWTSDQLGVKAATCTTQNKRKRRRSLPSEGFVPAIPPIKGLQIYGLCSITDVKIELFSLRCFPEHVCRPTDLCVCVMICGFICLFIHKLTVWSGVLFEKLLVAQRNEQLSVFYRRMFML